MGAGQRTQGTGRIPVCGHYSPRNTALLLFVLGAGEGELLGLSLWATLGVSGRRQEGSRGEAIVGLSCRR